MPPWRDVLLASQVGEDTIVHLYERLSGCANYDNERSVAANSQMMYRHRESVRATVASSR